jgi:hypothetical protein
LGSAAELETQLALSQDLGYGKVEQYGKLNSEVEEAMKLLRTYINRMTERHNERNPQRMTCTLPIMPLNYTAIHHTLVAALYSQVNHITKGCKLGRLSSPKHTDLDDIAIGTAFPHAGTRAAKTENWCLPPFDLPFDIAAIKLDCVERNQP